MNGIKQRQGTWHSLNTGARDPLLHKVERQGENPTDPLLRTLEKQETKTVLKPPKENPKILKFTIFWVKLSIVQKLLQQLYLIAEPRSLNK